MVLCYNYVIFVSGSASPVYVSTDKEIVLEKGSQGILPCRVERDVGLVTWSQGYTPSTAEILLRYKFYNKKWTKGGDGFDNELYDIHTNFSLVIKNVRISDDDGYFFCEILDIETGRNFWNNTDVIVYGE